jgi:hypothetical protein
MTREKDSKQTSTAIGAEVYFDTKGAADYTGLGKSSFDKWRVYGGGPPT